MQDNLTDRRAETGKGSGVSQRRNANSTGARARARQYSGWWLLVVILLLGACRATQVQAPAAAPAAEATPAPQTATDLPSAAPTSAQAEATATPVAPTAAPTATPIPVGEELAAVGFRLPPAVQHTTETTAELFVELAAPSEGLVVGWPEGDPAAQRTWPLDPASARQTVILDGLTPGVRYEAQVVLAAGEGGYQQPPYEGEAWGTFGFRTTGGERGDEPLFRAVVLGDSGFGDSVTYQLAAEMAAYNPDIVIQTGDAVYRMYEEDDPYHSYALKWFLPLKPLLKTAPIYPVVGNHDIEPEARVDGVPFYYSVFPVLATADSPVGPGGGRQWYAVERGDIQILLLDTQTFFGEAGRAEQDAWLAARLADTRFAHTLVAHHVPPFSSGEHPNDGLPLQQSWIPQYESSNVRVAMTGHEHNYERLEQNGVTYLISGGGSATLYSLSAQQPQSVVFARRSHFVLLDVWPDHISYEALALGGELLDEGSVPLP